MRTQNVQIYKLLYDEETSVCWIQAKNLCQGELKGEEGGREASQDTCSAILVPSPFSLKFIFISDMCITRENAEK